MRTIIKVVFLVDSDNPGSDIDSMLEEGAIARGYSLEEYSVEQKDRKSVV